MIFTKKQSEDIYNEVYKWLTVYTPGESCNISRLKNYQNKVWNPILDVINELNGKSILNDEEKEFLNFVKYNGPIYRIQTYNRRKKGYIYETGYCQSWSSSVEGVANISIYGEVLMIIGEVINGIDIIGLLCYLNTFNNIVLSCKLNRYIDEEEIVCPMKFENIREIVVVEKEKICEWQKYKKNIPKGKWTRHNMR